MARTHADDIRDFVDANYIQPARTAGQAIVRVKAGDVHRAMGLQDRMPAVASALGAKVFESRHRVQCLERTGPHNGANLQFVFEVLP